ncbi:MAG: Fic family protein [Phycisphaerales bacterium]|nr:MAG: Fic family protein [Phycisphaerales bacterium]
MILGQVRELDTEYRPWRKLRPIARDAGLDPVDAWAAAKFLRSSDFRAISLYTSNFGRFGYSEGRYLAESLHRIDRAFGGGGAASLEHGMLSDDAHRTRLRIRTLMDEAAESSLIEGAATTRKDAIELLRSRRDAKTKGERMVMNNFAAMQQIKQWRDRPLSPEMLRELQGILTEGTLKNPEESRRFRRLDEPVRVEHEITGEVIHTPPPAESLPGRVEALCAFANKVHKGAEFIHPIVKASILHFMIGYDHPFVDGNGRTARAVFYWYALRQGYSIFEYIPISERIRAGRSRYPQAYIDCELDEGDLTYFVLYKLDMIEQSLDALAAHIRHEEDKIKRSERLLRLSKDLSLRQRLILEHAIRHPRTTYTVKSHMNSNGITAATARKDLDDLVRRRLMTTSKRAREVLYIVVPTLQNRLQKKGL